MANNISLRARVCLKNRNQRATVLLPVRIVGSFLTARCGDARNDPPRAQPKSLAALHFRFFRQTLIRVFALLALVAGSISTVWGGSRVVAWGAGTFVSNPADYNDYGQSIVPTDLTNAVQVAGSWRVSLALLPNGTVSGWGVDYFGQTNLLVTSNYVAIACGRQHSLALESNGLVQAAGDDTYGQIDIPTNLTRVAAVAGGFYHSLVLQANRTVAAWGTSTNSSLYGSDNVSYGQAVVPPGLSNVVAIAAGGFHNLVLKSDGSLLAWGLNDSGQTNIPSGLSNVVAIAAGAGHNLVLNGNGTVSAWGQNLYGQATVPPGLSNVVAIACGGWHSLALKRDGTVVGWGAVSTNKLIACGQAKVPAGLTNVVQVAGGAVHSLALVGSAPPVTQAVLSAPARGTNGFSVKLAATRNGRVYQLEFKNSLTDAAWQPFPLQAGTGGSLVFLDPTNTTQRYYRVVQW